MSDEPDPQLDAIAAAFLAAGARFVVIGGFAVIANGHVRATRDVDLLVPDDEGNDVACERSLEALSGRWLDGRAIAAGDLNGRPHSRLSTRAGLVDLLREGEAPLDFATVEAGAIEADLGSGPFPLAGLESLVAFKRLARRPQDRVDLEELERIHGSLPQTSLPGGDA